MERKHHYSDKMVTVWDDKAVKKLKFEQFRDQALQHKTYLSIPGKEAREKAIREDYDKIIGNVQTDGNDTESRKSKPKSGNRQNNQGE